MFPTGASGSTHENELNEMGDILDCLGKYVPSIEEICSIINSPY